MRTLSLALSATLFAVVAAAEHERITLKDGRIFTGYYDEESKTIRTTGGISATLPVEPAAIVARVPTPEPTATTGDQRTLLRARLAGLEARIAERQRVVDAIVAQTADGPADRRAALANQADRERADVARLDAERRDAAEQLAIAEARPAGPIIPSWMAAYSAAKSKATAAETEARAASQEASRLRREALSRFLATMDRTPAPAVVTDPSNQAQLDAQRRVNAYNQWLTMPARNSGPLPIEYAEIYARAHAAPWVLSLVSD